jgi:putative DNA primase/helicase
MRNTFPPDDPIDQQLLRYKLAEVLRRWKIPVRSLDEWMKLKAAERAVSGIQFPEYEPWPEAVEGSRLIADLETYFARFVDAPPESMLAASLWTMWTHTFDLFDIAPLLVMTSATKRCGKTTMLRLVGSVAVRPLFSSNLTGAVLFRAIEKYRPTLLIDEADNFAKFNDDLKGLLNAGHERMTAQALRTVGDDHADVRTFSTWAPKAFTAIGSLPETIEDRSIRIAMRPILASLKKDRARRKALFAAGDPLARRCVRWAADNALALRGMEEPELEKLHSRAADNWAPLVMIAELCGVRERAEAAAVALVAGEEAGINELLLVHIRDAFAEESWISTEALLGALVDRDDGPWAKFWADDLRSEGGLKKASAALARRLGKFDPDLKAVQRMISGDRVQGYERDAFGDVWQRWIPSTKVLDEEEREENEPGDGFALAEPRNLEDLEYFEQPALDSPSLTSGNEGVHKVHKVHKAPAPREGHNDVVPESDGFKPGDVVRRLGGLKSVRFRVRGVDDDTVHAWELEAGQAGKLRSFRKADLVLVERKEEE